MDKGYVVVFPHGLKESFGTVVERSAFQPTASITTDIFSDDKNLSREFSSAGAFQRLWQSIALVEHSLRRFGILTPCGNMV